MPSTRPAKLSTGDAVQDVESAEPLDLGSVCLRSSKVKSRAWAFGLVLSMLLFVVYAICSQNSQITRQAARTTVETIQEKSFTHSLLQMSIHVMSLISVTFVTLSLFSIVTPLLVCFVQRRIYNRSRKTLAQCVDAGMPCPEITAIIPCFLPNEKDIIEDTVEHVMNKLEPPATLKTILVYNTPKDMPEIEEKLRAMERRTDYKDGRELKVIRVPTSKSKAENLNYILPMISSQYLIIYDADHHPDADSLLRMNQHMWEQGADIVQGSTYIRNLNHGFMAKVIDADFFVLFFGYYPSMAIWTQVAMFGGSNALISTHALQDERFSDKMQTEDIDLSVRLLLKNKKIVFCPEARSGELAPASVMAMYKQRLRWTIGWDQVALKYFQEIQTSNVLSVYNKFCLCHWLYTRWAGQILGVLLPILHFLWIDQKGLGKSDTYMNWMQNALLIEGFMFCVLLVCEAFCQAHHRGQQSKQQVGFVLFYYMLGPLCIYWQAFLVSVSMCKIFTGNAGNWVVTERSTAQHTSAQASNSKKHHKNGNLSYPLLGK